MNWYAPLADFRRYEAHIDKLHFKHSHSPKLYQWKQQGVSLASVWQDRRKIARLLADTVARGDYEFEPAQTRWITVNNKARLIYAFRLTDLILHGVLSTLINERMQPLVPPHLHSYIKGRSWRNAVFAFADYVRAHRQANPDPRSRGLYVLRRDIRKYSDSIPVGDDSRLWQQLEQLLPAANRDDQLARKHWQLLRKVVRPDILAREPGGSATGVFSNERGAPTGSPISTALFNLYLLPMDYMLGGVAGGHYARYCDDFVFAHPDPMVVQQVDQKIDQLLADHGLETSKEKNQDFYFNGAGRSSAAWPQARGTAAITFLGCSLAFDATVGLPKKKVRRLLRDVAGRVKRTRKALAGAALDQAGPVVCATVNQALDAAFALRHKSAPVLRRVVTDRCQLQQLDYRIARLVAAALAGNTGVKAFQRISYRMLRNWGLISLWQLALPPMHWMGCSE